MSANIKTYATLLYEICFDQKDKSIKEVIKKFVDILVKKNLVAKTEKIIAEFENIWNKREGILDAEVISAYELAKKDLQEVEIYLLKKTGVKKVFIKNIIDKKVKAGLIIKYYDKIIDSSLLTELNEFKKELIN